LFQKLSKNSCTNIIFLFSNIEIVSGLNYRQQPKWGAAHVEKVGG